jgi:hypothetical protein
MIKYQFFPRSHSLDSENQQIIECFLKVQGQIESSSNNLSSNEVLSLLRPYLLNLDIDVEAGKTKNDKISVPVLFGLNNRPDKCFNADGISKDGKIVLEIEAGRAVDNHQFLKDIFQASMMFGVEYLVLAVRNNYRGRDDFETIYKFLEILYLNNRIILPLKGILLIGY